MRRAGDIQIQRLPCRIESIDKRRRRRRDRPPQAAGERAAAVPGRPVHRLPAEGRPAAQLLAGDAAARRRAARAAHPARARRLLHRPAVHRSTRGARSCASRARSARSTCARTRTSRSSSSPAAPASRRSRRSSSTRCTTTSTRGGRWCSTGARGRRRTSTCRTCREAGSRAPQLHVHPGAVRTRAGRCVAGPHRPRPPGGARRLPRPLRLPGLRLRRAGDDRRRARELHGPARRCRPTSSSPTASPTAPRPRSRPDARPGAATPRRGSGLPNLPGPSRQRFSRRRP